MKSSTLLILAILLISTSCSKTEELDFVEKDETASNESVDKRAGADLIPLWLEDPENEQGDVCVTGPSNCTYFCCVRGSTISGFIDAIDSGQVSSFLTDPVILNELGQGFKYYEQLLTDVRDGKKFVKYYEYQHRETVMLLYGSEDLSQSNYEAAQALIR